MRVSRAQANENRKRVIDVASRLFREHGFDGIGLSDLMKGAGLTQGGFYKQFASKEDLVEQACRHAMALATDKWSSFAEAKPDAPLTGLVDFYLSPEHRDDRGSGCPLAALASDAARQGPKVKQPFTAGINAHLDLLEGMMPDTSDHDRRRKSMALLATMVGALLISRVVDDETMSKCFLDTAADGARSIGAA